MRLIIGFLIIFFLSCLTAMAQESDFEERKYTKENKIDWSLAVEFNTGFGILDVENENMAGIQALYGGSFADRFHLGAGTGIHLYADDRFLPLYLEGRYILGKGPTKFMLGASGGVYRALDQAEWERYINPFLGFTYEAFDHVALTISLGLVYKDYEIRKEPVRLPGGGFSNVAGTREIVGRFFSIRFGCLF